MMKIYLFLALATMSFSGWTQQPCPAVRLRVGVVSDIHVSRLSTELETYEYGNSMTFRHALEWFDACGVDAVVCAGDMSDRGTQAMLEICGRIWEDVFPRNHGRDGRPVEPIFIYGNHDSDPKWFDRCSGLLDGKTEEECARLKASSISRNEASSWTRAFGEDWSPIYLKSVKGYSFVCVHWGHERGLGEFLRQRKEDGAISAGRPFFCVQHPAPRGTIYGTHNLDADDGTTSGVLSKYPDAVSISGHSHISCALETSIWQGAFTAIGASSLAYQSRFRDDVPSLNVGGSELASEDPRYPAASSRSREGLLLTVYDDRLVVERREFVRDAKLGPDWVIPLGLRDVTRPYAPAEIQRRLAVPTFPKDARLGVSVSGNMTIVSFPSTLYSADHARCVWYELEVVDGVRTIHRARLMADEFFAPLDGQHGDVRFFLNVTECPQDRKLRFEVRARDIFDRKSEALCFWGRDGS